MFLAKSMALAATLVLAFSCAAGAEAQIAPNRTNVAANVTIDQNLTQSPQPDNLTCRLNPRAGACRQPSEQRTASGAQRQGSGATKGGGPRPARR